MTNAIFFSQQPRRLSGSLPAFCHDLRQLPEASGLLHKGHHEAEAQDGRHGRAVLLLLVLIKGTSFVDKLHYVRNVKSKNWHCFACSDDQE